MQRLPRSLGWLLRAILVLAVFAELRPVVAAQPDDEGPRITAVRFWSLGDVTRIAIESSGELHFKADRLRNPDRLFFDLPGTKPALNGLSGKGVTLIGVNDRYLRQIRVAETQRGVTRVVFDLVQDVEYSTSQLANPDRLIIEVRSVLMERPPPMERITSVERPLDRPRTLPAPGPSPMRPTSAERSSPRLARLDFSDLRWRREEALRAMVPPVLDPPSPFDFSMRFATRLFNKPDPMAEARLVRVNVLPPPPRPVRVPTVLTKTTPEEIVVTEFPVGSTTPRQTDKDFDVPMPAKHTGQDTMTRVLGLKLGRVVLDPGHGGHDGGTEAMEGLEEKDICLDVARRLGALIQERLGSEVIYTRTDDTFIPLSRRTAVANEKKADLFLSIHVNSSPVRSVGGVETYYLNFTNSKSALDTAMRENAGADKNIGELQDLLKKIALKDKADESREFASRIQASLLTLGPKATRAARDRGVKRAPFVVLIGASMPSVLAEIGFISNPQDASLMRHAEYRQRIAEALYKGLASYANSLSHFQVAQQSGQILKSSGGTQ